jgi:hypothetical protein
MSNFDRTFSVNYEVDTYPDGLGADPNYTFGLSDDASGGVLSYTQREQSKNIGVLHHSGFRWTGLFQAGGGGISGVYSTPSPDHVCVVVAGEAYWVDAMEPQKYEVIGTMPARIIYPIKALEVLIFIDFVRVVAYGRNGLLWTTSDLSWDGIDDTSVEGSFLRGTAWDAPNDQKVPFSVDLRTGETEGGSSPDSYGLRTEQ